MKKIKKTLNLKSPTLKCTVSGLRGVVPEDLSPENIPGIIAAIDRTLGKGPLAVARDNRPTGEAIEQIVIGTLRALGREVHSLSIVPTPTIKAYIKRKKLAGGVMISASHNPENYNAFKMIKKQGEFFEQNDVDRFLDNLKSPEPAWVSHLKYGKLLEKHNEAIDLHIDSIISAIWGPKPSSVEKAMKAIHGQKKLKIAVDTLGACATPVIGKLLERLNVKADFLFPEIMERFPRPPEPTPKALALLSRYMKQNKCDLGFAFDPDADRLAIVGPDGPIGEELTLPLAMKQALKTRQGKVVVNLSSSYANHIIAESMGSALYRSKVGEAFVTGKMKKLKAVFGGEGNGGVIDPVIDSYGRDALAGVAWVLALIASESQSLPELLESLPRLYMKKIAIQGDPKAVRWISAKLDRELSGWGKITEDGIYYHHLDGIPWIHIRASNTEPIVRVIAEANSPKELNALLKLIS